MDYQQPAQNIGITDAASNIGNTMSTTAEQVKTGFNSAVSGFSTQAQTGMSASQSFLQSNTIIAKFAFLILILIGFLFLFALGINLMQYFFSAPTNPYLIYGMIEGNVGTTIPSDPKQSNAVIINRSNNESKGLEFTWSYWIYINDLANTATTYQHVFNKGDVSFDATGVSKVNNGPGVYLTKTKAIANNSESATLHIIMDTSTQTNNTIDIDNIPLRKWVHVAMRMQNTIFDIYVNGIISNRLMLQDVPKQNYNDVNIGKNGGFPGKLSNLRYYTHALNAFDINNIVSSGPNTNQSSLSGATASGYSGYLSNIWYSNKM
jgi:hypothetical protein